MHADPILFLFQTLKWLRKPQLSQGPLVDVFQFECTRWLTLANSNIIPFLKYRKEPIKGQLSTVKGNEVRKVSSKVLHSVEMVEKTIISAVRDEVDTLFHDRNHEQTNWTQIWRCRWQCRKQTLKNPAKNHCREIIWSCVWDYLRTSPSRDVLVNARKSIWLNFGNWQLTFF
jgi:hypothetical protein